MSTPNDLWDLWDLRGAWGPLELWKALSISVTTAPLLMILDFEHHSVGEASSEAIELAKPPF